MKKFEFDTDNRNVTEGTWDETVGKYDIDLSTILSTLINRTSEICELNSSDLFPLWNQVMERLSVLGGNGNDTSSVDFAFGIYNKGVDGNQNIMKQVDEHGDFAKYEYKELYLLRLNKMGIRIIAEFATCYITD